MKTWTVIYRTGGTRNFKWNRVLTAYHSYQSAVSKMTELERMGYKSLIHDTKKLDNIGLPETYEV